MAGIKQAIAKRKGKASGVLLSTLKTKIDDDMKIIALPGFENVQRELQRIADKNADWFPLGFNGIHAVSNPELFAGFNPDKAVFYISVADELVPGFSPAKELQLAVEKMTNGQTLTFNNEYAVETLWHEIIHGRTGINAKSRTIGIDPIEEGLVQIISRYSYHYLVNAIGSTGNNQGSIITNGYAYHRSAKNMHLLLSQAGISQDEAVSLFLIYKDAGWSLLIDRLPEGLNVKRGRIITLLNHAKAKAEQDFKEKILVTIRNAQRS